MNVRRALPILLVLSGCGSPNAERRGDEAYAQGHFADALATYREISGGTAEPRVLAKTGAAALRAGKLGEATEAFLRLAGEDPTRGREAAAGLESVAQAAEAGGDRAALQDAILGLRTIAPDAVPGRYALVLAQQPDADPEELVSLLPGAIAAAGNPGEVDSLLLRYGRALEATAGCGQALLQYRAVARRAQDSTLRSAARARTGQCAFTQGQRAQSAGRQEDAALWFAEASRVDSASAIGRRALVSLGDLRLRQGDTLAAALAFQTALTASGRADSIANLARTRLARLRLVPNADDTVRQDMP